MKLSLILALTPACGGGETAPAPRAKAAPASLPASTAPASAAPAKAAPPPETPEGKGVERFAKLAKQLDEMDAGNKPVDPQWLESQLREVLDIDSKNSAARFNLGVLAEKRGDKNGARKIFENIASDDPDFVPAGENLAAYYVDAGDAQRAAAIYDKNIKADPKNLTSRLGMARILQADGKYQQAIELCRQVLQRKADEVEAFRILAESYQATGDISMSELIIGRALKVSPEDERLHYLLAQIMLGKSDLSGGVDKLKQVIRMRPTWAKPRAQLAEIALKYEDFGNAAQQFEAILKEMPDNRAAKIGLAVSYKGLGRYDQAEKIYKELLAKNGDDFEVVWNLAVLYYRHLNRYDDAIAFYSRAKSLAPSGDDAKDKVDKIVDQIQQMKKDEAARKAREERERKKREALQAACQAVAAGKKPNADAIGSDEDRIKEAWDLLLVTAVGHLQAQPPDEAAAKVSARCAMEIVPNTPGAGATACGQLRQNWVQILDQAGLLTTAEQFKEGLALVREGLKCDPENPDLQTIEQQLAEFIKQAEGGGAQPAPAPAPAPTPPPRGRKR